MNTNTDMHIAGCGNIPAGEYNNISISGSGKLLGKVRCESFSCSGSGHGESIECKEWFKVSGASSFSGDIKVGSGKISGALSCGGNIVADTAFYCYGSTHCAQNLKGNSISAAGTLKVGGDIEAEEVQIKGAITCEGLLNAEDIEIRFDKKLDIGGIGGSKIVISHERNRKKLFRLFSRSKREKARGAVASSIEGDEISLESVACPRVAGRIVTIKKGCNIDLVQYSENVEISPNAKVGKTEKI